MPSTVYTRHLMASSWIRSDHHAAKDNEQTLQCAPDYVGQHCVRVQVEALRWMARRGVSSVRGRALQIDRRADLADALRSEGTLRVDVAGLSLAAALVAAHLAGDAERVALPR